MHLLYVYNLIRFKQVILYWSIFYVAVCNDEFDWLIHLRMDFSKEKVRKIRMQILCFMQAILNYKD